MKIAIDESGDSGRKFWAGSSKLFILTAVIVPDNMMCGTTCQAVDRYRIERAGGRELHFAHNSHEEHIDFLRYIHDHEFIFVSICIDKPKLYRERPYLLRNKISLLSFTFEQLFIKLQPWLDDPVVLMDTSGSKWLNKALRNT